MCYLQEPTFDMDNSVPPKKEKKSRKAKNKTGEEVVQSVLKTPEPQMIENAEPLTKKWTAPHYTTGDKIRLQKYLDPEPQMIVNEQLPSYEEMQQAYRDLFNGPSSMERQPYLAPVHIMEEGVAVLPDGRQVEWWPPNLDEVALQEYLMMQASLCIPTLSCLKKDLPLVIHAPCTLAMQTASRQCWIPFVTAFIPKSKRNGERLPVIVD